LAALVFFIVHRSSLVRFARGAAFAAGAAFPVGLLLAVRPVVLPALLFAAPLAVRLVGLPALLFAAPLAVRPVVLPALPFAAPLVFVADAAAGLAARGAPRRTWPFAGAVG